MLEIYFQAPTRLRQLRRGPLSSHIDSLAAHLHQQGYSRGRAREVLGLVGKFSLFARVMRIEDIHQIDGALAKRFLAEQLPAEGRFQNAPSAIRLLLQHLCSHGVIKEVKGQETEVRHSSLLHAYDAHLCDVQGLRASTREAYLRAAGILLAWLEERHGDRSLTELTAPDVLDFITDQLDSNASASWRKKITSQTRIFLRYLRWADLIEAKLDRVVPKVTDRRLASIPHHLPWEQVRTVIDSVDTTHPQGMRDRAILLLLARLGLRNHEVRTLELKHIRWRAAEIRLPRSKGRRERILPLPHQVGAAIADYLLHGRPPLNVPHVFLRHKAPVRPFNTPGGIGAIVKKHLRRAGIEGTGRGTHLLRHSMATRMVNVGVPIKTIADILGHTSIDTTAIYTKVDITHLAAVALPFPGGAA